MILLVLATILCTVSGQGCSVCGEGQQVGRLDGIFAFPGQPTVPCGVLEQAGEDGEINQCSFLPGLIPQYGDCDCRPIPAAPYAPTISQPPAPTVPGVRCSVCGDGRQVGRLDGIFVFPGQPIYRCGVLEQAGEDGEIPLDQCPFLVGLIDVCECRPVGPPAPYAIQAPVAPSFVAGEPVAPIASTPVAETITRAPAWVQPEESTSSAPTFSSADMGNTQVPTLGSGDSTKGKMMMGMTSSDGGGKGKMKRK